jgi:hypothetical protein
MMAWIELSGEGIEFEGEITFEKAALVIAFLKGDAGDLGNQIEC